MTNDEPRKTFKLFGRQFPRWTLWATGCLVLLILIAIPLFPIVYGLYRFATDAVFLDPDRGGGGFHQLPALGAAWHNLRIAGTFFVAATFRN